MLQDFIRDTFTLKENEGENKVMPLSQAIKTYIQPGMTLYVSGRASLAVLELSRQFWNAKVPFDLICLGLSNYYLLLLRRGLLKKCVTSVISWGFPKPGPISMVAKAEAEGKLVTEIQSAFLQQARFMAGALGLKFMPTKTLRGTSLAEELSPETLKEIDDPFTGEKVAMVKPLMPDVTILHGQVADPYGNTILSQPASEIWGMRAGKRTIVTVEKIVTTDFIRQHSYQVQIPGYLVNAVCVVPFGAHPGAMPNTGLEGVIEGYQQDYDFSRYIRDTFEDPQALDQWIEEWLLKDKGPEDYLHRLGEERLNYLKQQAKVTWQERAHGIKISKAKEYTSSEMTVIAAARMFKKRVLKGDYRVISSGAGTCALAASLCYYMLQKEGYQADIMNGGGLYGYLPRPGRPMMGDISYNPTAKMYADTLSAWAWLTGGSNNRCLSTLGVAQVDKYGDINVTQLGRVRLFGGGGANDATAAGEIALIISQHRTNRLVEKVPYITAKTRDKTHAMVTQLGEFEKRDGEFVLIGYVPGKPKEERLKELKEGCGWDLKIAPDVAQIPPPTKEELTILRYLDPEGIYIGE